MSDKANSANKEVNRFTTAGNAFTFGEMFRRERKALGLTLEETGKRAGCRRQTIADIEAGKNVGLQTVFRALSVIGKQLELRPIGLDLAHIRDYLGDDWHE